MNLTLNKYEQEALLKITKDAVIVCDLKNRIVFWNKAAERLYGMTEEEVKGKNIDELLFYNEKQLILHNNQDNSMFKEIRQINKQGKDLIVESSSTIVYNSKGEPTSKLIINTDITEKKNLEANFVRIQRLETIGALAGGIAHDLNNVLAPILMSVQILKKRVLDPMTQRLLATLESTVERGVDLVKQILLFSRGFQDKNHVVNVKQIVNEIEILIKEIFPRSIELIIELDKELWPIFGDATQIHQILLNLCLNSRDAMPKGGLLKLSITNVNIDKHYAQIDSGCIPGRYVLISVSDTGQGISAEHLEKIFEPFFTTKEPGKGTGLGLSTVMSIVKSYQGFINVVSEINKGSVFNIYFPVTEQFVAINESSLETNSIVGNGELILVIDDEVSVREITKATLEMHNYRVITASDGIDGLTVFVQNRDEVKLVITDVMMPNMDGVTTIKALQQINPDVRVICISGQNFIANKVPSLGVIMLSKPFSMDELLYTIKEAVESSSQNFNQSAKIIVSNVKEETNKELELQTLTKNNKVSVPVRIDQYENILRVFKHDFSNELGVIYGCVGGLQDLKDLSPNIKNLCEMIDRSSQYCQILLQRLYNYFQVSEIKLRPIKVLDIEEKINMLIKPRLPSSVDLDLYCDQEAKGKKILLDFHQFTGVLLELVSNATNALREKGGNDGIIKLHIGYKNSNIFINVEDNGLGIPKMIMKDLFKEPLPSRHKLGLGLLLSKQIVSALGGELNLDVSTKEGTVFIITLPTYNQ